MTQRQLDLALLGGIGVLLLVILALALSSAPTLRAGDIIRRLRDRPTKLVAIVHADTSTGIRAGTWEAVYWNAQTALSALDAVLGGERHAFALCRPPGHHAGADYLGG